MSRDEIFAIWPRPWRRSDFVTGMVLAADGSAVLEIDPKGRKQRAAAAAFADFVVEWSQEKP